MKISDELSTNHSSLTIIREEGRETKINIKQTQRPSLICWLLKKLNLLLLLEKYCNFVGNLLFYHTFNIEISIQQIIYNL